MIHIVDYRDHFFKYPYHILLFDKKTWQNRLNPGDLPGWRLYDHLKIFEKKKYSVKLENIQKNIENFNKIKSRISSDYNKDDEYLAVTQCTIFAEKPISV